MVTFTRHRRNVVTQARSTPNCSAANTEWHARDSLAYKVYEIHTGLLRQDTQEFNGNKLNGEWCHSHGKSASIPRWPWRAIPNAGKYVQGYFCFLGKTITVYCSNKCAGRKSRRRRFCLSIYPPIYYQPTEIIFSTFISFEGKSIQTGCISSSWNIQYMRSKQICSQQRSS